MLWIVELFIWLVILFIVSGSIMLAKYTYKRQFNTYQIFLPDVDGLINGSPVRLMGIQVGYVNQIDIVGDDVYIKFIITTPKTRIPKGSTATVEFAGLGGSKSLEIYPPKVNGVISDRLIIAKSPKRIHDSLGLLSDMFEQVSEIAYKVSHFMGEIGIIKNKQIKSLIEVNAPKQNISFLNYSEEFIKRAQNQCDRISHKIKNIKNTNNMDEEVCKRNERRQNKSN